MLANTSVPLFSFYNFNFVARNTQHWRQTVSQQTVSQQIVSQTPDKVLEREAEDKTKRSLGTGSPELDRVFTTNGKQNHWTRLFCVWHSAFFFFFLSRI